MQYRGYRSVGSGYSNYLPFAVKWLLIVNTAIFVVEWISLFFLGVYLPSHYLYLVPADVLSGQIWRLATYMFFHGNFVHLVLNMLMLWMFGMQLERDWGPKRFLQYYFLCGAGAGVCVMLVTLLFRPSEALIPTLGASGAIYGLLLAFGVLYKDTIILVMLLFPMKAKYAVMIFGAIEFVGSWSGGSRVSHVAHLGGMLFGYIYLKARILRRRPARPSREPRISLRHRFEAWKSQRARKKFQVYMKKQQDRDRWVH